MGRPSAEFWRVVKGWEGKGSRMGGESLGEGSGNVIGKWGVGSRSGWRDGV